MKFLAVLLLLSTAAFASKTLPQLETARVISQDISMGQQGYAVMPMGSGIIGAPLMRRSNVVVVETTDQRITWVESGNGRHIIVLPVNGKIHFYRDGNWFIVRDSKGKKHKFGLVHLQSLVPYK